MASESEEWESASEESEASWTDAASEDGTSSEGWEDDDETSEGDIEDEEAEAGKVLVDILLSLVIAGAMSARVLCTICWWAWKAGCRGEAVKKFAHCPDAQSGKFQKKIDRKMGVDLSKASYRIPIPTYAKGGLVRTTPPTPVELPSEVLAEELENEPGFDDLLDEAVRSRKLPPSYFNHEVR